MIYYSHSTGGFYDGNIHGGNIPTDAVAITADEHQALLDGQSAGKIIVADDQGRPILADPPPVPLERIKESAFTRIDTAAEAERAKYITPGSGQAMVYQRKLAEAGALLSGSDGSFPHLEAEVGVTAPTLKAVAEVVLTMEEQWVHISAVLEGTRLIAKSLVRKATTPEEIEQIVAGITWPTP